MKSTGAQIGELWFAVNREIHERFRQAFRGSDLPPGTMLLLRQIIGEPGLTVSELARRSGLVKSFVSTTLDQLVAQGHVEKRPDPGDQRLLRIYVTPTAEALMAFMQERAQNVWVEVVNTVPEQRIAEMIRGLQAILTALEQTRSKSTPE